MFDLTDYLSKQKEWSTKTFGPGLRAEGNCRHIEKELAEIRKDPTDVMEWIDVVILALDGAWRAGHSPMDVVKALQEKQDINFKREWPAPSGQNEPVEHVRKEEAAKLCPLAVELLAACRLLIDAPHYDHFCTRLNDHEMDGIDAIKAAIAKAVSEVEAL